MGSPQRHKGFTESHRGKRQSSDGTQARSNHTAADCAVGAVHGDARGLVVSLRFASARPAQRVSSRAGGRFPSPLSNADLGRRRPDRLVNRRRRGTFLLCAARTKAPCASRGVFCRLHARCENRDRQFAFAGRESARRRRSQRTESSARSSAQRHCALATAT